MHSTKYHEQLDEMLINFYNSLTNTPKEYTTIIMDEDAPKRELLNKLVDDGYVYHNGGFYTITINGRIFLERGGYVGEFGRDTRKKILSLVQIWAIIIGTLGLLFWDFYKTVFLCK